jgi:ABC-type xylose transport system, periplasmic component
LVKVILRGITMKIFVKKRSRKRMLIALMLAFCIFCVTACGSESVEGSSEQTEEKTGIKIGLCFDSFIIERWRRDSDVFVAKIKEYDSNAEVNVQNANGDIEIQKAQIRYLIEKKYDVLVIVCIDSESLSDVCAEAKSAGIPIIAYDRLIKNADVDLYISFDNEKVGTLMGEALVNEGLPNNKVLMLSGPNEDNNVSMVENGFRSVMEKNGVEIADCVHTPGWKAEAAAEYINANITNLGDIDAIMCGNDNIATTIIRTLAEARLAGKIKIVGQDADLEACQRIVEGTQVMTVYKPVEKLAQAAAEYAIQLAENKQITGVHDTINDGTYDVPYLYLEPIAVTKDNIDETVIDSGFHLREEVYLNVPDEN